MSYEPDPLEPRELLRHLIERADTDVRLDAEGPWSATWFPLEPEVRIADGLTLGEANALALFYSPAIRAARADAEVAGAQVLQAGVLANPQLFLGPRISTEDSDLVFPVFLAWELPLWGKLDAERDIAAARWDERRLAVVDVELETLKRVREAFLRLGRLRREEEVMASVATSSEVIVQWVEALRETGEVDAVALYLARSERDDANAALENVRAEALRTRRELFAMLGLLPEAPVTPVIDASTAMLPVLPDSDGEALLRVPSLRAAQVAYEASEAALRWEISKQYPGVKIGPEYEYDRGDTTLGIGLAITLPLFDRNKGGIAAAEEARERAREHYRSTLLRASHAEAGARDDLETAERVLQIHREGAMRDAEDMTRSLQVRLLTGRADVVETLATQRSIARTRARMLELEEQVAIARLRAAVAGGLALQTPFPADNSKESEK